MLQFHSNQIEKTVLRALDIILPGYRLGVQCNPVVI